ncbi:P-loop containing nucleoside triphosphate hydrolase protein [Dendrothele bispora CBS 962.96]|uniref:P-loop containing nucleoside triphosphate hydrolase protein n=1 Tax=Dendrothele bispora (strain CBS 962.96) TaxID=1314807 RepID=A0A4S8MY51_DENBC|nr:P-loop containing nucleoside triphosphate hydrolase protein [Dendrothele bispora CBS 962.96]
MPLSSSELEDAFVNVCINEDPKNRDFFSSFVDQSSAKHSHPGVAAANLVRKFHPGYSVVSTSNASVLGFPEAKCISMKDNPLFTSTIFIALSRSSAPIPGSLVDRVRLGSFNVSWQDYEFILYVIEYPMGFGIATENLILHDGPEEHARQLVLNAGLWGNALHNEIWVFNQGFWQKDAGLWYEIQKADWKDVILKEEFKKSLKKDVYGFFESEQLYKDLGIPWKRGLILHGPPGNGKTISLKTIMKTCDALGYAPLYVKSFTSYFGDEYSMEVVFGKARQLAPCVIILEDLDSLINDSNRSFFLNQLDGLEGNDGLLVIGTTNHFDRLDPGISTRPSRFDRKYLFDDPDQEERVLYVRYWQNKLKDRKSVPFPDSLVQEVADATDKFSFAYLKEVFVSSLVLMAGYENDEDRPSFRSILMDQIKQLRKQLNKPQAGTTPQVSIQGRRPLPTIAKSPQHQFTATTQRPTAWSSPSATQEPGDVRLFTSTGLEFFMGDGAPNLHLHPSIRGAYHHPSHAEIGQGSVFPRGRRSVPGEFLPTE